MWGTVRALLSRSIQGVTDGFTLPVRLVGVGYRASLVTQEHSKQPILSMKLGYCHPIDIPVPEGIDVSITQNGARLTLKGIDWQQITQFAANIRKWRKPEPFNGKGVFVGNETVRRKVGKKK